MDRAAGAMLRLYAPDPRDGIETRHFDQDTKTAAPSLTPVIVGAATDDS